ncbi:MAG: dTMP kinase [Anaerolineae bacterium]|nr:dTMP kinase [Anaerolineae bacterium]
MVPAERTYPGLFISLEGTDGAGKTTQAVLLSEALRKRGLAVINSHEPGGTRIGEQVRAILHDVRHAEMLPATEVLLFAASRAQHVGERIRPALEAGQIVVCDRYSESTLAYQGYGRGLDLDSLREITRFATGNLRPDLVILLDLDAHQAMERRKHDEETGGTERNRLDRLDCAFYERVRRGYRSMADQEPGRWLVLDATRPITEIHQAIWERVDRLLDEGNASGESDTQTRELTTR